MNKAIAFALLALGIVLLVFGLQASNSITSEVSKAFTGSPTNKAVWLIGGGVLSAIAGLAGIARSR
jgi:hypothetical protein